jgi:hypothetical protein
MHAHLVPEIARNRMVSTYRMWRTIRRPLVLKWVREIPDRLSASASVLMIVATCYQKKNAQA